MFKVIISALDLFSLDLGTLKPSLTVTSVRVCALVRKTNLFPPSRRSALHHCPSISLLHWALQQAFVLILDLFCSCMRVHLLRNCMFNEISSLVFPRLLRCDVVGWRLTQAVCVEWRLIRNTSLAPDVLVFELISWRASCVRLCCSPDDVLFSCGCLFVA